MIVPFHKARVVCSGRDLPLLRTRLQVLVKSYDAIEVSSVRQLAELPGEPAIDLVLLCHSLSPEECSASAEIVRERWPAAKMLALTTGGFRTPYERADAVVLGLQGPVVLLQAMDRLIGRGAVPSAAGAARAG